MNRVPQIGAAVFVTVLLSAASVQATPVTFTEVIQVINGFNTPAELRLKDIGTPVYGFTQEGAKGVVDKSTSGKGTVSSDSLLGGVAVAPQSGADIVVQGEVDGTVCDCGEIWVEGGFPKWPLIFLAGIPFIFIDHDDLPPLTPNPPEEPPSSNPSPTPTPTTPTPEPASLLLLGTGLAAIGAGIRRRRAKSKHAAQRESKEEESRVS